MAAILEERYEVKIRHMLPVALYVLLQAVVLRKGIVTKDDVMVIHASGAERDGQNRLQTQQGLVKYYQALGFLVLREKENPLAYKTLSRAPSDINYVTMYAPGIGLLLDRLMATFRGTWMLGALRSGAGGNYRDLDVVGPHSWPSVDTSSARDFILDRPAQGLHPRVLRRQTSETSDAPIEKKRKTLGARMRALSIK